MPPPALRRPGLPALSPDRGDRARDHEAGVAATTGSIFTLPTYLQVVGGVDGLQLLDLTDERGPLVLAYSDDGRRLTVHTTCATFDPATLHRVADQLLKEHPHAGAVTFTSVEVPAGGERRALTRAFPALEDIALSLPDSAEAYRAALGRKTRKHSQYYLNRLERTFPDARFVVTHAGAIPEAQAREVLRMNTVRMSNKGKTGIGQDYADRLVELLRSHGTMLTWQTPDRTLGGALCWVVGSDLFLHVIAHDPDLDQYDIGHCVVYSSVLWAIENGLSTYHFLWGDAPYKFRFQGKKRLLADVWVFRDSRSLLRHGAQPLARSCYLKCRRWAGRQRTAWRSRKAHATAAGSGS